MANTIFDLPRVSWSDSYYSNQIMIHDLTQPESSTSVLLPIALLFSNDLDIHYKSAIGSYGNYVIDWGGDRLIDNMGYQSLLWNHRKLQDNADKTSVNWDAREGYDVSGHLALSWGGRYLCDSSGNSSFDWQNKQLLKADGSIAFDWQNTPIRAYKTTSFLLQQHGTNDPFLQITLLDELSLGAITFVRNSIGYYTMSFSRTINYSYAAVFASLRAGTLNSVLSGNSIDLYTRNTSGVLADDILNDAAVLKIEYYL